MANSLSPAFAVIAYSSVWGAHKMTIPTLAYDPLRGTGGFGGYLAWDGSTDVDAETMFTDLVNDMKVFFKTTSSFVDVTIYKKDTPSSPSIPQVVIPLAIAGTSTAVFEDKATQKTMNFRTAAFGKMKIVMLDIPIENFDKLLPAAWSSADNLILGALTDTAKAFSGRDNNIPANPVSITNTLNEKLRREYGQV